MQGITYKATKNLRDMKVGDIIILHPRTNESTVRNACSKLKKDGAGVYKCEKRFYEDNKLQGFMITRIA